MGLLDRFRGKPPMTAVGDSGRGNTPARSGGTSFLNLQPDEFNAALTLHQGYAIFDQMWRGDAEVRKTLLMLLNPMIGATWTIEPYGGENADDKARKHAEFVEWALFKNMAPRFPAHVSELMRVGGRYGFAPFEQVWGSGTWEGKSVLTLQTLGLRLPKSVWEWITNPDGTLAAIVQNTPLRGSVTLPVENLVYYRFGAEGDNWEGESLLRAAYKPWKMKDTLEWIEAVALERFRVGLPVVYPPQGASEVDLDAIEEAVQNIRANTQGYLIMPGPHATGPADGGWSFEIMTPGSGEGSALQDAIKSHKDAISANMVQEFMRLGQANVGARATAEVQADPFLAYCEAITSLVIEDTVNTTLIPRLVSLNFDDADGLPELHAALIDSTSLSDLATFVSGLITAGAIHPDNDLEDFLRARGDLPPADPEARKKAEAAAEAASQQGAPPSPGHPGFPPHPGQPGQPPPHPGQPPQPGQSPQPGQPKNGAPVKLDQPGQADFHSHMALDAIEATLDNARDELRSAVTTEIPALARAAVAGEKPDLSALEAAVQDALGDIYDTGRASVQQELSSQGADVLPTTMQDAATPPSIEDRAHSIAEGIFAAMAKIVMLMRSQGVSDAGDLLTGAEQRGRQVAGQEALDHASGVLAEGRQDEADANADQITGTIYTSILDKNRCDACARADDGVTRALDDPVRLRNIPPNRDCAGWTRCRCMEFYVYAGGGDQPQTLANWVENRGGLPQKIWDLAKDLIESGHPESEAIAIAVSRAKHFAVTAKDREEWAHAVAEWEAMKSGAKHTPTHGTLPHSLSDEQFAITLAARWDETKHPRGRGGRFVKKGSIVDFSKLKTGEHFMDLQAGQGHVWQKKGPSQAQVVQVRVPNGSITAPAPERTVGGGPLTGVLQREMMRAHGAHPIEWDPRERGAQVMPVTEGAAIGDLKLGDRFQFVGGDKEKWEVTRGHWRGQIWARRAEGGADHPFDQHMRVIPVKPEADVGNHAHAGEAPREAEPASEPVGKEIRADDLRVGDLVAVGPNGKFGNWRVFNTKRSGGGARAQYEGGGEIADVPPRFGTNGALTNAMQLRLIGRRRIGQGAAHHEDHVPLREAFGTGVPGNGIDSEIAPPRPSEHVPSGYHVRSIEGGKFQVHNAQGEPVGHPFFRESEAKAEAASLQSIAERVKGRPMRARERQAADVRKHEADERIRVGEALGLYAQGEGVGGKHVVANDGKLYTISESEPFGKGNKGHEDEQWLRVRPYEGGRIRKIPVERVRLAGPLDLPKGTPGATWRHEQHDITAGRRPSEPTVGKLPQEMPAEVKQPALYAPAGPEGAAPPELAANAEFAPRLAAHDEMIRRLSDGPVTQLRRNPAQGSSESYTAVIDGQKVCVKPNSGGTKAGRDNIHKGEDGGHWGERDVAADSLSRALGLPCPAAVMRTVDLSGEGGEPDSWCSVIEWNTWATSLGSADRHVDAGNTTDRRIAIFDLISANSDRHWNNVMKSKETGEKVPIDHNLCWGGNSATWGNFNFVGALEGEPLTGDEQELLSGIADNWDRGLGSQLRVDGLTQEEVDAAKERLDLLLGGGRFPDVGQEFGWYGRGLNEPAWG